MRRSTAWLGALFTLIDVYVMMVSFRYHFN
jgi:hypothetical protein